MGSGKHEILLARDDQDNGMVDYRISACNDKERNDSSVFMELISPDHDKWDRATEFTLTLRSEEIINEGAGTAFQDLFNNLQLLQKEYSKLEKTKQSSMPSPPNEIPQSIHKMLKLQTAVISVQAWWRKILTLKRLQQET